MKLNFNLDPAASGALPQVVATPVAGYLLDPSESRPFQELLERYRISYRLVMLGYRLGRRLRGRAAVADGAALAIALRHRRTP